MTRPRVGISACLLGQAVRYDGAHKLAPALVGALADRVDWVPVCPEVGAGLGTPREPMSLVGERVLGNRSGADYTAPLAAFTAAELDRLTAVGLAGFVLKSRSPSCGVAPQPGLFARALRARFPGLPIAEETDLGDPARCEDFLTRVAAYREELP
jgi:uncharacterized protein YbbK (DUF523 family)